jgi:cell division protein FtsI/penicillin-binding protein 2
VPGEASGTLRPRGRGWVQVETASAAFGQGISVTNLQLAMGMSAIANGGELYEPILVKKVTTATGELVREAAPTVRRRAIPENVARAVRELLVAVTEGPGTGVEARDRLRPDRSDGKEAENRDEPAFAKCHRISNTKIRADERTMSPVVLPTHWVAASH